MDSCDEAGSLSSSQSDDIAEDDNMFRLNNPREDEKASQRDDVGQQEDNSSSSHQSQQPRWNSYHKYLQLIEQNKPLGVNAGRNPTFHNAQLHELRTSPLFSSLVRQHIITSHGLSPFSNAYEPFPQFGLLGIRDREDNFDSLQLSFDINVEASLEEELVFTNMDAPWSTFICGSQGGGKSHTLSCLLENALLKNSPANKIAEPLAGLIFHYDQFSGFTESQLCEAAFFCSHIKNVRVLVAPTSEYRMRHMYSNLPGLPEGSCGPQVIPLYIQERHLDISNLVTMMAVSDNGKGSPLYLEVIYDILRRMARQNQNRPGIDFRMFENYLSKMNFTKQQLSPLRMRLQLLRSFLDPRVTGDPTSLPPNFDALWKFEPGTLTIIDLSDPFVKADDACALFSICLAIFMANCESTAKVVALDEAHKFLNQSGEATKFTEDLLQIIRQQRHLGTRVLIATQEPTLSPKLLDLSNVRIIHRFDSPAWFDTLAKHLAGVKASDSDRQELFRKIVGLGTGEAFVFCPMAVLDVNGVTIVPLKDNYTKLKIRKRITTDGGRSIMASDQRKNGNIPPLMHEQASGPFDFSRLASYPHPSNETFNNGVDIADGLSHPAASNSQSKNDSSAGQSFSVPTNSTFDFSRPLPQPALDTSSNHQDLSATQDLRSSTIENNARDVLVPAPSGAGTISNSLSVSDSSTSINSWQVFAQKSPVAARASAAPKAPKAKALPTSQPVQPNPPLATRVTAASSTPKVKVVPITQSRVEQILHDLVTKSLSADPDSINQQCFDKWRKKCADQLNVSISFFQAPLWRNFSRSSIKKAAIAYYKNSGRQPPQIPEMAWLWQR